MTRLPLVLLAAASLAVSACGDERVGTPHRTTTLTLANASGASAELHAFADEVARRSEGALTIRLERADERAIIGDVAAGRADLGSAGTRAFRSLGIHAFDALTARTARDRSEAMLRRLTPLRRSLGPWYVEGLGILAGPLRPSIVFAGRSALAKLTSDQRDELREAIRAAHPVAPAIA